MTPYGKIFKILFPKFSPPQRSMMSCWNVVKFLWWEISEIVHYLPDKKLAPSQTAATVQFETGSTLEST